MFLKGLTVFNFLLFWNSLVATGLNTRRRRYVSEEFSETFPLSENGKQAFVDAHNKYRRLVQPIAANMRVMTWDDELAALAETYSKNCSFDHSSTSYRKTSVFSVAGENIYAGSSYTISQTYDSVPKEWYDEIEDYTYETRSCSQGKICGHYTQLAWAETYKVGCTIAVCNSIQGGHGNNLVICNYGPAGNAYDGSNPLPIYEAGDWCSSCGAGDTCEDNLCANSERDQSFTATTTTTITTAGNTECDGTQCGPTEAVFRCIKGEDGSTECICNDGYATNSEDRKCVESSATGKTNRLYFMRIKIQCIMTCLIMALTI